MNTSKKIYLDYAAATPIDQAASEAMEPYYSDIFYNPSADYLDARAVKEALSSFRRQVATTLGAKPLEIIFTTGATEANNLAIQGIMRQFDGAEVVVGATEHESVIKPAQLFNCKLAPVEPDGRLNISKLTKLITDKTVLISVGLVNNEIGTIQPVKEISAMVAEIRKDRKSRGNRLPIYVHTDATQAPSYLDLHVARLGVDLISLNGGKIYGPKQSGALFVKAGTRLQPIILGGGQEFGLRSGTENLAAVAGFTKAFQSAQKGRANQHRQSSELKDYFINEFTKHVSKVRFNTPKSHSSPHIINFSIAGQDNERLVMELDEQGIQVASGSACSASSELPSHVLKAIGLTNAQARASLRVSIGKGSSKVDLEKTIQVLKRLTEVNR